MKLSGHGQAKILTPAEIRLLFTLGFKRNRARDHALFGICLYTACRIREACTLLRTDVYDRHSRVRSEIIFRKSNTKGKLATRTVPVLQDLKVLLECYRPPDKSEYLFPGQYGKPHIHPDSAAWLLREACREVGLEGVSTHSFRRTALTQMSAAGIPLRVIQEISGHRDLNQLHRYLEVRSEQVKGAIASLSMLTPVEGVQEEEEFEQSAPLPLPKKGIPF